jgi:hypothetical protein
VFRSIPGLLYLHLYCPYRCVILKFSRYILSNTTLLNINNNTLQWEKRWLQCKLKHVANVVCYCTYSISWKFPLVPPGAPTYITTRETSSRERWNYGREMTGNFADNGDFHAIVGIFYMPQRCDMRRTELLPLRRKACWGFFRAEKSAWFESANVGTRGPHATPRPPKPRTVHVGKIKDGIQQYRCVFFVRCPLNKNLLIKSHFHVLLLLLRFCTYWTLPVTTNYRIYSRNLRTFFSGFAAENSRCVKYADFFCGGFILA